LTLRDRTGRGFAVDQPVAVAVGPQPGRAESGAGPSADRRAAGGPGRIGLDGVPGRPGCAVLDRGCPPLDSGRRHRHRKSARPRNRARTPRPSADPAASFRAGICTRCRPSHHVSRSTPRSSARASGAALTISQSGDSSGSHRASAPSAHRPPPGLLQAGFQQVNSHPGFFQTHPDRRRSRMVGSRSAVRFCNGAVGR